MESTESSTSEQTRARWLQLAPPAPKRPLSLKWDVFISYRSVNRTWALALHDALREPNYQPFLDQFVLPAGQGIATFLRDNLKASASGIVIWSGDAATSEFVEAELAVMRRLKQTRPEFHYVLAKLDQAELPFLEQGDLYVDFADYPEGPRGGELLKLMFGLTGQPLSAQAVREIHQINEETTQLVRRIGAARKNGTSSDLEAIIQASPRVLQTTSLPYSVLIEALIKLGSPERALDVVKPARQTFSRAIRLQQLEALALRRLGRTEEAQRILSGLYDEGHRDPETLGILGATWMQRYKVDQKRSHLERSQSYYVEAFELAADSYYNGINAAAKAALLGKLDEARELAERVLPTVESHTKGEDYWATASHAEAKLILGQFDAATKLYRAAVVRNSEETGSISTTCTQALDLLVALGADASTRAKVLAAFES